MFLVIHKSCGSTWTGCHQQHVLVSGYCLVIHNSRGSTRMGYYQKCCVCVFSKRTTTPIFCKSLYYSQHSLLLLGRRLGAALPLARLVVPLRAERCPPARLGHAVGLRFLGDADPDAGLAVPGGRRARRASARSRIRSAAPGRTWRPCAAPRPRSPTAAPCRSRSGRWRAWSSR